MAYAMKLAGKVVPLTGLDLPRRPHQRRPQHHHLRAGPRHPRQLEQTQPPQPHLQALLHQPLPAIASQHPPRTPLLPPPGPRPQIPRLRQSLPHPHRPVHRRPDLRPPLHQKNLHPHRPPRRPAPHPLRHLQHVLPRRPRRDPPKTPPRTNPRLHVTRG